ncbi:MAG: hypothetical protein JWN30_660, partial [Bacilli bacterium]|nr:hypothetical protein [Bacilli bacterium]
MPQRIQYAANQAQQALNNIQQIAGSLQQPGQFADGTQSMFQPGFAGTNAQSQFGNQGQFGMQGQLGNQGQFQQGMGMAGAQSMFQPGFAGTRVQEVRQDIARDLANGSQNQSQFGMQGQAGMPGQFGSPGQFGGAGFQQGSGLGGAQAMFQPGFAGTNAQQIGQQIAQDGSQNQSQFAGQGQFGGVQFMQGT